MEEPLGLERHDITDHADRDLLIAARAALTEALASLPPLQALALVLRYVHDLPDREIAAALGCRRGTVNALLSRARARLRDVPELDMDRSASRRPRRRRARIVAAAAVVFATGAYAVPATRGAVDDVYGALAPWVQDDGEPAPGRATNSGDVLPDWMPTEPGSSRVVAENGGVKLVVARESADKLSILLGNSVGLTESVEDWRRRFAGAAIAVVGMAALPDGRRLDDAGRRPLLGLAAPSVKQIELRYDVGPPTAQRDLHGGFVLFADAHRKLRDLVGFDAQGRQVTSINVSRYDLRVCMDARGCPPGRFKP